MAEREAEGVALAVENAAPAATVYADEAPHRDALHGTFDGVERIDHSESCVTEDANTDQAESCSRLRRMVDGQHHHVSARHLYPYAAEAASKENDRRMPNGGAFRRTLGLALAAPVSRQWKECWERNEG